MTRQVRVVAADADATRAYGTALAAVLRAGDVVVLTGGLGAGKTTLTQGVGTGLGVRGPVVSPTFTIARVQPSLTGGPALVHVDAYRLGSPDGGLDVGAELEALDLDASLDSSVTVVEWGAGWVEALTDDRLEVNVERPRGGDSRGDGGGDGPEETALPSGPAPSDPAPSDRERPNPAPRGRTDDSADRADDRAADSADDVDDRADHRAGLDVGPGAAHDALDAAAGPRVITVRGVGSRWSGIDLPGESMPGRA